jgi:hypothetical protein
MAFVFTFNPSHIVEEFLACGPKYEIVYKLHMQGG